MRNNKGISPVIILIIVAILATGGFFIYRYIFTPEEDKTEDWKNFSVLEEDKPVEMQYKGVSLALLGASLVPDGYFPKGFDASSLQPVFADLDKAEQSGINALAFSKTYWADEQGGLGMIPKMEEFLISFIDEAHARNFKIWLSPDIVRPVDEGSPHDMRRIPEKWFENTDLLKNIELAIIETAKFAEEHDVEIFSPTSELYVEIGRERSKRLIVDIKPKIDAAYSGKICLRGEWPIPEFLSLYSCFGAPVVTPKNEEEKNELINKINFQMNRKDKKIELIISGLWEGNDWQGSQEDAKRDFETVLEIVEGKVSGVFITDIERPLFPESFEKTIKEFYTQKY